MPRHTIFAELDPWGLSPSTKFIVCNRDKSNFYQLLTMEKKLKQAATQILITEMLKIYHDEAKDVFDRYSAVRAIARELGQELDGQKLKFWFMAFLNQHNQPQTEVF